MAYDGLLNYSNFGNRDLNGSTYQRTALSPEQNALIDSYVQDKGLGAGDWYKDLPGAAEVMGRQYSTPEEAKAAVAQWAQTIDPSLLKAASQSSYAQRTQDWNDGKHNNGMFGTSLQPETMAAIMAMAAGGNMAFGGMSGGAAVGGPGSAGWGMDLGMEGVGAASGAPATASTFASAIGGPGSAGWGMDLGTDAVFGGGYGGMATGAGSVASSPLSGGYSALGGSSGSLGSMGSTAAGGASSLGGSTAASAAGSGAGFGFPAELGGGMASGVPAWDAAATKAGLTLGTTASGGFLGDIGKFLKDNPTLAQLGGAALGALSAKDQNQTSTSTRDPWGPAQQYLKDNLATNAAMQKHYQANPFSTEQQGAYQGLLNTLANNQANGNVLLGNASKFGQSSRGQVPQMAGLLTGTQAPIIDWAKYQNIGLLGG